MRWKSWPSSLSLKIRVTVVFFSPSRSATPPSRNCRTASSPRSSELTAAVRKRSDGLSRLPPKGHFFRCCGALKHPPWPMLTVTDSEERELSSAGTHADYFALSLCLWSDHASFFRTRDCDNLGLDRGTCEPCCSTELRGHNSEGKCSRAQRND